MMRAIFSCLGVILIGPVTGFFGTYFLYSLGTQNDCMWKLAALGLSLTIGASLGAVTFGVIGFCVGYRLDKQGKQQLSKQEMWDQKAATASSRIVV